MSNQEQDADIVEFFASTRPDNPLTFLLRVDKDEAERWGIEGWYPINRGIAGFGKRLDNGETVMLHRLIMGAQPGDIVKFHDDDNTNITKKNMYIVGRKDKGAMVASTKPVRPTSGRGGDHSADNETGDDMDTPEMNTSPFGRRAGERPVKAQRTQAPVKSAPASSGEASWLPIASQFSPVANVITTIDYMKDDENPRNEIDIVMGFQEYDERDRRSKWYTISVQSDEADNLREYLYAHVDANALQVSQRIAEYKQRVQELERENAQQAQRIDKLTNENGELKKRIKDVEKLERRFKNIAVSLLDDAA